MIKGRLECGTEKMDQDLRFRTKAVNSKREPRCFFYVVPSVWPRCECGGLQQQLRAEAKHVYNMCLRNGPY